MPGVLCVGLIWMAAIVAFFLALAFGFTGCASRHRQPPGVDTAPIVRATQASETAAIAAQSSLKQMRGTLNLQGRQLQSGLQALDGSDHKESVIEGYYRWKLRQSAH